MTEQPQQIIDWLADPRTFTPEQVKTQLPMDTQREIGCYVDGADGFIYRIVGWRHNDGPWIKEVLGRGHTPIRTISLGAVGRTFHHHRFCPCSRRHYSWELGERSEPVIWTGAAQYSDGFTAWVADQHSGSCIGRISAKGAEIFYIGNETVWSAAGQQPNAQFASFEELIAFEAQLRERFSIQLSRAVPIRLRSDS